LPRNSEFASAQTVAGEGRGDDDDGGERVRTALGAVSIRIGVPIVLGGTVPRTRSVAVLFTLLIELLLCWRDRSVSHPRPRLGPTTIGCRIGHVYLEEIVDETPTIKQRCRTDVGVPTVRSGVGSKLTLSPSRVKRNAVPLPLAGLGARQHQPPSHPTKDRSVDRCIGPSAGRREQRCCARPCPAE
jgi:hypothetical protein